MLAAVGAVYVILAVMLWLWMSDRPLFAHRLSGDGGQERTAEEAASGQPAERGHGAQRSRQNMAYKVEINEVMQALEEAGMFFEPDLQGMEAVRAVSYLPAESMSIQKTEDFYRNRNNMHMTVLPLLSEGRVSGYVRFDYIPGTGKERMLYLTEGILFFAWIILTAVLWYIRQRILKPFHVLSGMPYELAKGNLQWELKEHKSRFFGKFIWGVGMLQDALRTSRQQALKLEKEKKLLLLSISHDIKIPLSAIKLYAKALQEGIYGSEEEKIRGARQIAKNALEIEEFVKKIIGAASEDVVLCGMEQTGTEGAAACTEFYLKDLVEKVRECYAPKCRLLMTQFRIDAYENKLLRGNLDLAFEVVENLMENAFKYGDGKEIRVAFGEEDYCQLIEVYNSGEAVAEEEMPHLFDSFYRGTNAGEKEGNGLGLYIGRQLMRKMEGDIFAVREQEGMRICLVFREDL